MRISFPHNQTKIGAITHVKKMLNDSRAQMAAHISDVTEVWNDNVLTFAFTAQKQHIKGTLEVTDRTHEVTVHLPLMLRMFEGQIEKMIMGEMQKVLGK